MGDVEDPDFDIEEVHILYIFFLHFHFSFSAILAGVKERKGTN
jgi:hypothetical protein